MARGTGAISLLVNSPLRDLAVALRAVGPETRKQINSATRGAALPIWQDETRGRAATALQRKALVSTARVGVTSRNVILRSGGLRFPGRSGENITAAAEFGGGAGKTITSRTARGTVYARRLGAAFGPRRQRGAVVYPAAAQSIPRFASLWVQTARRTIHEALEKAAG